MPMNGEIHNTYNLYNISDTVTIVASKHFTKETYNFKSIVIRNNSSTEETLKSVHC